MKAASVICCIGLLALAACQPGEAPAGAPTAPGVTSAQPVAEGCSARAEAPWGPAGAGDMPSYRVVAYANGTGCEASVVTLAILARDGRPVFTWASAAEAVFGLDGHADASALGLALSEWISPAAPPTTTAVLPPWDQTDGQPGSAEFPFMPSEWIDKATYEALRSEAAPLYCFVQGRESEQCLALRDGQMEEIGLQLFPG